MKIKICGITNLNDARAAVEEGADALGFIFYPKSPRYISYQKAGEIIRSLPPFVLTVGVFVNETEEKIRQAVKEASLSLVQLHGDETSDFCKTLGLRIIKAIRVSHPQDLNQMNTFPVQGILLDTYHPDQYGGTGKSFNWEMLRSISKNRPGERREREGEAPSSFAGGGGDASPCNKQKLYILSGGLTPENVREAIDRVSPYAVDVSSGVEESPGKKDREKIKRFIQNAKGIR